MKTQLIVTFTLLIISALVSHGKYHASNTGDCTDTLLSHYFETQEALAADNIEAAKLAAKGLIKDDACAAAVQASAKAIIGAANIKDARLAFKALSDALIPAVESNDAGTTEAHLVHCPMAFEFSGASWLQKDKSVANPYFGSEMLACGAVKASYGTQK